MNTGAVCAIIETDISIYYSKLVIILRFGVITDIHNNLPALKAVTQRLNKLNCDRLICCGDIIGIGPYPEETVQFIMQIPNLIAVRGNHEKYLLEGMPVVYPNEEHMSLEEFRHHKWEHSLLSKSSVDFLMDLPYKAEIKCGDHTICVMHYCMDQENNYVNYKPNPNEQDLKEMFADVESDIILYGHDHQRNICKVKRLYINAGSLGCPGQSKNIARACILDIDHKGVEVSSVDIEYNANDVVNLIDKLDYPDSANIKKYFYGIW